MECSYLVVPRYWRIFGRMATRPIVVNINVDYIRAICYDEAVYPDPHIYDPTRFLDKDGRIDPSVKAPEARVFGSGRRYEYCDHAYHICNSLQ